MQRPQERDGVAIEVREVRSCLRLALAQPLIVVAGLGVICKRKLDFWGEPRGSYKSARFTKRSGL